MHGQDVQKDLTIAQRFVQVASPSHYSRGGRGERDRARHHQKRNCTRSAFAAGIFEVAPLAHALKNDMFSGMCIIAYSGQFHAVTLARKPPLRASNWSAVRSLVRIPWPQAASYPVSVKALPSRKKRDARATEQLWGGSIECNCNIVAA